MIEAPRLLLVDSTKDEQDQIEKAFRDAGTAPWFRSLRTADLEIGAADIPPEAAIVCGKRPDRAVKAVREAHGNIPVMILTRSGPGPSAPDAAGALETGKAASLPELLRRLSPNHADDAAPRATTWARQLLESAVDASQDLIMVCDATRQRLITCNPAARRMLGYTPDELVGDSAECLFPDREAFEEFTAFLGESLQRWGRCDTVLQMVHRDGHSLDVAMNVTALPPGLGLDDWVVGTIRDITGLRDAERAVSETREHLESTLDSLQDAVITVDPETRTILSCNPAVESMFGYPRRELIGSPTEKFFPDRATYEQIGDDYATVLDEGGAFRHEMSVPHRDGHSVNVELTISALSDTLGWRQGIVATFRDVTGQRKAEERARLAESVIQNTVEAVMITDLDRRIVEVNPAFERLTGYAASEIIGRTPDILRSDRHDASFYRRIREELDRRGFWQGEIWHRRKDGTIFPSMASTSALRDDAGNITHYSGIFTDISHNKHVQERLDYLTRYDTLTGLPNRASFEDLIGETVAHAGEKDNLAAVFFLDIDHFKTINETLGHSAGDQLLRDVAKRLSVALSPSDEFARLGGDEFGIITRGISDPRDAANLSKQLLDQLQEPFSIEGRDIYVSASIGITLVPADGSDARSLMKNADSALYRAKEQGRNHYEFFSRELNLQAFQNLVLVNSLREGLERGQFELHYQPRVSAADGRIVGAEALLRWNHPDLGLTMPNQFIGLAEQAGLIGALGDWVMRTALATLSDWRARGLPSIQMSINLSPREFAAPELAATLRERLAAHDLDSSLVELEITEGMLMSDPRSVERTLRELRDNGVSVVIDDFGTGYSSLSYLKHFPISGLKIDQSFIRGIPDDADDTAITRAVIAIAQSLNLHLIAEGVETEKQAEFLRRHGCEELQGFLFSPPVAEDAFRDMLAARSVPTD